MSNRKNWAFIGGVIVLAAIAVGSGVPFTTILLVCAALACPAAMYFGMSGKPKEQKEHNEGPAVRQDRDEGPRKTA